MSRYIVELEQLQAPTPMHTSPMRQHGEALPRWKTAPERITKFYVHAGISHDHEVGAAPAVCRDCDGAYLDSSVLVIRGLLDPAAVEAITCQEALALAKDLGVRKLLVASDSKVVVGHIQHGDRGNYEGVIKESG